MSHNVTTLIINGANLLPKGATTKATTEIAKYVDERPPGMRFGVSYCFTTAQLPKTRFTHKYYGKTALVLRRRTFHFQSTGFRPGPLGGSVGPSVGRSIDNTALLWCLWVIFISLLLPKYFLRIFYHYSCPPACDLGSRVFGLVFTGLDFTKMVSRYISMLPPAHP